MREEDACLPSPPPVGWPSFVIVVFFFLEEMRLALECKADTLDAGRGQADDYSQLRRGVS